MNRFVDYSQVSAKYDRRYDTTAFDGIERALVDFVGDNTDHRVLEAGCGTGHWLAVLESRGFSVAGLDASSEMLERAKNRAPNAALKQGRADRIPWKDKSFDRVVCINAFHHFDGKGAFISEARRVLRADGGLMIIGLDPLTGLDRWCVYDYFVGTREIDRRRYLSSLQIEESMRASGFSGCHTSEAHHASLQFPARQAIENGLLDKTTVSQLGLLTDAEYQEGLSNVWRDIRGSEARGEQLVLVVDVRFHATIGWNRRQMDSGERQG